MDVFPNVLACQQTVDFATLCKFTKYWKLSLLVRHSLREFHFTLLLQVNHVSFTWLLQDISMHDWRPLCCKGVYLFAGGETVRPRLNYNHSLMMNTPTNLPGCQNKHGGVCLCVKRLQIFSFVLVHYSSLE